MLVRHLPRDSAVNREIHGEAADWSVTDHLLAAVVDHLAAANWMFACVNSAEDGDQPEPPIPVPRPSDLAAGEAEPEEEGYGPRAAAPDPDDRTDDRAPSTVELARFFA